MKPAILSVCLAFLITSSPGGVAAGAFGPTKPAVSKRTPSAPPANKPKKHLSRKKPDLRALQMQAEADMARHEREARYREFLQMQQAQQRGYQQMRSPSPQSSSVRAN